MFSFNKLLLVRTLGTSQAKHLARNINIIKKRKFSYFKIGTGTTLTTFIVYDYVVNDFTYCGATSRFLRSLKVATQIAFDYLLLQQKESYENYEQLLKEVHLKSAKRLLDACLNNGGLYIKVGQGVSAINHILPIEYTQTLCKLHDQCLQTTKEDVQEVFKRDFGQLPEEIYENFDYKPIAAASLAQVFRAKLKTGEDVAIKVQYSDLQKRFTSDLGTIMFLQDIIELFFKNYNFSWIMQDLKKNLIQELNFVEEGKNSEKCARDLQKFKFVYIPKVYWNHTKERVLTLEWIDGVKITNINDLKKQKLNLPEIDFKLFTIFAEQIFNTGFVHADPHPGNIFVRKAKNSNASELVILDHGLYETVPEKVRLALCDFWEATVLRDEKRMKRSASALNINEYKNFAQVLFQVPFEINGGQVKTKLSDEDIKYMQLVARNNFDRIMQTLREMPRNMLFVVRNLNTIRAISRHHGDVVDRPKVMARHAQRCLYTKYNSFVGYLRWICRRALFEYCLLKNSFKTSVFSLYINTLYKLGRSPITSEQIFKAQKA
ncbi:uncharacterized aarF domain-containing protein kinase 5 [Episyrphus balteatus]|uniref:uncharacterized aarF domain-containing protein kinase 5 n=1 Tax=Episyrphus balteatus TaxID=286459 RepID=UPI002485DA00|nr:uncharacterized aarF domain-containing protein kinase 5 [Episyrphus balteatus]